MQKDIIMLSNPGKEFGIKAKPEDWKIPNPIILIKNELVWLLWSRESLKSKELISGEAIIKDSNKNRIK